MLPSTPRSREQTSRSSKQASHAGGQVGLLDVSPWAMGCLSPTPSFTTTQKMMQSDFQQPGSRRAAPGLGCRCVTSRGYLAAAGVVVNDLGGDGIVRMGEEHLRVAV